MRLFLSLSRLNAVQVADGFNAEFDGTFQMA
jgi:hypothetical protein